MRLSTSLVNVIFCLFLSSSASLSAISFASSKEINLASSVIFPESESFVIFDEFESSLTFSAFESSAAFSVFESSGFFSVFESSVIFSESDSFVIFDEFESSLTFSAFEFSVIFTSFESTANAVIVTSESSIAAQSKIETVLFVLRFINNYLLFFVI